MNARVIAAKLPNTAQQNQRKKKQKRNTRRKKNTHEKINTQKIKFEKYQNRENRAKQTKEQNILIYTIYIKYGSDIYIK